MTMPGLPPYYTRLDPFRPLFASGTPILTFHKLGPRPPRVKRKGLYLPETLFERQLAELRRDGYLPGTLDAMPPASAFGPPTIVLTFDDGCVNTLQHGLLPMERHGFRAIQFLVAGLIGASNAWDEADGEAREPLMDADQIREWLDAGHAIGSHSMSHPDLTQLAPVLAREEIASSKKRLEDLFAVPVDHFCYPYGAWSPAVRDLVEEAGYRTACTTEFGVNTPRTPALALLRITARYRSTSLKSLFRRTHRPV